MSFRKVLLMAFMLIAIGRPVFAVLPAQVRKPIAPFERHVSNNLVAYDFLFLPEGVGESPSMATYDSVTRLLRIRFRVRIPGFGESPLRYHLPSVEEYENRLQFFAFRFSENILLTQDSTLCQQSGYLMDANLNAGPFESFIVAYRLPKPLDQTEQSLHLRINDPVLYGGVFDISINKDELQ